MKIETIKVGEYRTNCYLVREGQEAFLVDPGFDAENILDALNGLDLKFILLTHGHFDHVLAVDKIKEQYPKVDVYINEKDIFLLDDLMEQGMFVGKLLHFFKSSVVAFGENDSLNFAGKTIRVIETPGHTPGGNCYLISSNLFSGDTLFYHTYGRVDLPYSNKDQMLKSLKKLSKLPENTKIWPGHGKNSTINEELINIESYQ